MKIHHLLGFAVLAGALCAPQAVLAQRGQASRAPAPAPRSAQEAAPIDLTGYWVAVIRPSLS